MSSKRAMRQAQKQAFAKHRSNISNSRLDFKKKNLNQEKNSKIHKKDKKNIQTYFLSLLSTKNKAIINITVHANTDNVLNGVVSAPQTSKNKAPIIIPIA